MQIFVTGGTGFLGSYLLRYLVQKGYTRIRALKRKDSPMALVAEIADQIEWVEGDILDLEALENAMKGASQIYHCAAVVSYDPKEKDWLYEVNVQGTANIVNIALEMKVKKLVHVSSIAALGRNKRNNQLNESSEWQGNEGQSNYSISKHLAEMEVWRGIAEGLNAAMINPSVILGSGFWKKGTGQIFMNAWNEFPFYPRGGAGFVDVRDVAKAAIKLMESDIAGERYIINADNLSFKEQMNRMSEALNKKSPIIKVTLLIQEVAWRLAAIQGFFLRKRPFITKETARMSAKRYYYSAQKSIDELGMNYIPFEQTVEETSRQLEQAAKEDFSPKYLPLI